MVETATGLVLRTRPLTETSLIVQWLTPELGRLATVAKGARRPNSPLRGKLDLFYLGQFSFVRSRRSELHTLREVTLTETHPALRHELQYLQQAAYAANLLEDSTETETPLPGLFELMRGFLSALPARPPRAETVLAFELRLLEELGLAPVLAEGLLTPGSRQLAQALAQSKWSALVCLTASPEQRMELRQFLHGFLIYHLGKLARGREEALSV
jgi:DNA repair protein RecO (recombination protein O)